MADVITVTAGSAGQAGSTAAELITYMSARLLEVAELNTILDFVSNGRDKISSKYLGTPKELYARIGQSEASERI